MVVLCLDPYRAPSQPCWRMIRSTVQRATSWPWPRSQIHSLRDPRVCTNLPTFVFSLAAVMISTSSVSRNCRRVGVLAILVVGRRADRHTVLREHRTHGLDTPAKPGPSIRAGKLVVLVIGDEPDHRLPGRSSSGPKKIAAAFRISLVI